MDALVSHGQLSGVGEDGILAIELRDLTVRFESTSTRPLLAVDRASFAVPSGEFVSIVGISGCGKTTILNLLAGLLPEGSEGEIRVLGKSPFAGNPDVAYMLARDSLLPWRTALGNATYGLEIRHVAKEERERQSRELLGRVGL